MTDSQQPPNVLWITADQLRFDGLGSYGNEYVDTPNLDRMAAEGAQFNNAFVQAPVCTPSRASFLTGRYPRTIGLRQNGQLVPHELEEEPLVPRTLQNEGYVGGLAGKLHLAPCNPAVTQGPEQRYNDGYNEFYWSHHPQPDWPTNDYTTWLRERGEEYTADPSDVSPFVEFGPDEANHQSTWCVDRAVSFVERVTDAGRPWHFSLNFFDPHHPFDPPREAFERYRSVLGDIPLPNYQPGELDNKPLFQQIDHRAAYNTPGLYPFDQMSSEDHQAIRAAYWAMIDVMDRQLGRLFDTLTSLGVMEDTIVIFSADHGELLGDHGMYLKGPHFYEPSVKVPLIIKWGQKVQPGTVVDELVELTDLAPTILEATGQEVDPGIQGRSLLPRITGSPETGEARDDVYSEYLNAMPWHQDPKAFSSMLRTESVKIVRHHGQDLGELYDLSEDPNETVNLWDEAPELRREMAERLLDRIAFTADALPERVANW